MNKRIKMSVYVLCLLVLFLLGQVACASGESNENTQMPLQFEQVTFTSGDVHTNALNKVFFLSDNEIWYNFLTEEGYGKLLCFDVNGKMIETLNVDLKGKDPCILCINRVGDRLIVGYQDDSTNRAEVIILDSQRKEVARTSFETEVYTIQMAPSERGILYAGEMDSEDGMAVFYLTEIDVNGEVLFEYTEPVTPLEADQGYLGNSLIASDGEYHYAMIKNGVEGTLQMKERLVCFNTDGEKLWETAMDEAFYSNNMAVSNGYIYIVGAEGERDEYGCLENQKGMVLCYDQSRDLLWQQSCSEVAYFYFALSSANGCYAISNIMESQTYMLFVDEHGMTQTAAWLELPENAARTYFQLTDTDQLIATGKTTEALYIGNWVK